MLSINSRMISMYKVKSWLCICSGFAHRSDRSVNILSLTSVAVLARLGGCRAVNIDICAIASTLLYVVFQLCCLLHDDGA